MSLHSQFSCLFYSLSGTLTYSCCRCLWSITLTPSAACKPTRNGLVINEHVARKHEVENGTQEWRWSYLNLYVAELLAATRALKGNRYEEKVAVLYHFHKSRHLSSFGISPHADRGHEFVLCKHERNSDYVKLNGMIWMWQERQRAHRNNNRNMKRRAYRSY